MFVLVSDKIACCSGLREVNENESSKYQNSRSFSCRKNYTVNEEQQQIKVPVYVLGIIRLKLQCEYIV